MAWPLDSVKNQKLYRLEKSQLRFYYAFIGPLSKIPGPWIEKIFPELGGLFGKHHSQRFITLKKYHEKYGHIVRIGPTEISISDKDMLKQILVTEDLSKGLGYKRFQNGGRANIFDTTDKGFHRQRRRLVSPAFSIKYINSLEPLIESVTESLIARINRDIEGTKSSKGFGQIDIWRLFQLFSLDVVGETSFGGTFNALEDSNHVVPVTISKLLRTLGFVVNYPWIVKLLRIKKAKKTPRLVAFATDIVLGRLEKGDRRNDILQIMIDTQKAAKEEDRLSTDDIISEITMFLVAGTETISGTMGFVFIELCRHKNVWLKLRDEIDGIVLEEGKKFPCQSQLKDLPYLNAVINETMRLNSIVSNGIDRIATRDIFMKGDVLVPEGTTVRCSPWIAQTHPDYWPEPLSFNPDRWLPGTDSKPNMEAYFPFSTGSRNCIGKTLAINEMRLVISALIKNFDLDDIPKEMMAANEKRYYITLTLESGSFKLLLKPRNACPQL
ncbi:cytochrome P450 CYP5313 [Phycomyces blakesleeanus]|uniref:Cytochrome P450 CYP5313 n=2 Tax=Phycomyces blakesleeanus TaxID=4837 RepID=A0A163D8G6_PHYB8|nr:cytochrome P450 CYP5313 [Phycomyces blakesleeanus NRRL 1555(-)]OAD69520.1 cytochrome P450 CYP5313 [Phycomyces blakesleeanus NRRL 1555(-)]|eukprot:XP_018287560.1 cytochrome P450 CYP5313 [Phycomyces blakesleeanus NRRL 1555(-)]